MDKSIVGLILFKGFDNNKERIQRNRLSPILFEQQVKSPRVKVLVTLFCVLLYVSVQIYALEYA